MSGTTARDQHNTQARTTSKKSSQAQMSTTKPRPTGSILQSGVHPAAAHPHPCKHSLTFCCCAAAVLLAIQGGTLLACGAAGAPPRAAAAAAAAACTLPSPAAPAAAGALPAPGCAASVSAPSAPRVSAKLTTTCVFMSYTSGALRLDPELPPRPFSFSRAAQQHHMQQRQRRARVTGTGICCPATGCVYVNAPAAAPLRVRTPASTVCQ